MNKRTIIHVSAGTQDWNPSTPQGWMWSGPGTFKHPSPNNIRKQPDLILTPIFTNTEDKDITISDLIKDTTQ